MKIDYKIDAKIFNPMAKENIMSDIGRPKMMRVTSRYIEDRFRDLYISEPAFDRVARHSSCSKPEIVDIFEVTIVKDDFESEEISVSSLISDKLERFAKRVKGNGRVIALPYCTADSKSIKMKVRLVILSEVRE